MDDNVRVVHEKRRALLPVHLFAPSCANLVRAFSQARQDIFAAFVRAPAFGGLENKPSSSIRETAITFAPSSGRPSSRVTFPVMAPARANEKSTPDFVASRSTRTTPTSFLSPLRPSFKPNSVVTYSRCEAMTR